MPLKKTDVHSALLLKGFKESTGDHNYFTYHSADGKKTPVFTKTSHGTGSRELGDILVSMMAKQLKLNNKQFKDLINCPLSRDDYEKILKAGAYI